MDNIIDIFAVLLLPAVLSGALSKGARVLVTTAMLVCFITDVILPSITASEAVARQDDLADLVNSGCFSAGAGYESIVKLRDTLDDIASMAFIQLLAAFIGAIADAVMLFQELYGEPQEKSKKINMAVNMMFTVGELSLGWFDFIFNILELVAGVQDRRR